MEELVNTRLVAHGTEKQGSYLRNMNLVLLFFGAGWAVSSRELVPYLSLVYDSANQNFKRLEVVYVPLDSNDIQFRESFREMPWVSIKRSNYQLINELKDQYAVDTLPKLVLLNYPDEDLVSDVVTLGPAAVAKWERRMK